MKVPRNNEVFTIHRYAKQQKSKTVKLKEGGCYYISAAMREGGGGDNLSIGVRFPRGKRQWPMSGQYIFTGCPSKYIVARKPA